MGVKMKYYIICFPQDTLYGIAFPDDKDNEVDIPDQGKITDWKPIIFNLIDGSFSDYQANSEVCRLCSEKLRSILDTFKSQTDEIQWLPVTVRSKEGEEREYYILHFENEYDVIDWDQSITVDKHFVVKPVFSIKKIDKHKVFNYPSSQGMGLLISEDIKNEVEKAGCTNLSISKVPLVE